MRTALPAGEASYADSTPRRRGVLCGQHSSPERRPMRTALLVGEASYADSTRGLCPLDSRNFFEKKLSKSFIPPAGGDLVALDSASAVLTGPPERLRAGRLNAFIKAGGMGKYSVVFPYCYRIAETISSRIRTASARAASRKSSPLLPVFFQAHIIPREELTIAPSPSSLKLFAISFAVAPCAP